MKHPNLDLLALGIQQPWAELILCGVKTVEVRTVPVIPKTIYIYASSKLSQLPDATVAAQVHGIELESLPRGMIVGTVMINASRISTPDDAVAACVSTELLHDTFSWELHTPVRLALPLVPKYIPYGMWFYPFQRKNS